MDTNLNIHFKIIRLLEKSIERNLHDFVLGKYFLYMTQKNMILYMTQKNMTQKNMKIDKPDLIKIKSICSIKDTIKIIKNRLQTG